MKVGITERTKNWTDEEKIGLIKLAKIKVAMDKEATPPLGYAENQNWCGDKHITTDDIYELLNELLDCELMWYEEEE